MNNCLLCQKQPADKTGSHIIPFFIIKSMVNEEGKTGRDKEVSFKIGTDNTEVYFGRSVSTGAINEVLGRDITEEELDNNLNHYTQDNFLCSSCEKRLSYIESYYSKKGAIPTKGSGVVNNEVESPIALLFWASILWRVSVTNFPGPKLRIKEQKKLRNVLDICLGNSIEETKEKTQDNISLLIDFHTIILYVGSEVNPTENACIAHPIFRFPYSLIINEYVIFFYFKKSHFNVLNQLFWGFEKYRLKEYLNSLETEKEIIFIVPEEEARKYKQNALMTKVQDKVSKLDKIITTVVRRFFPNISKELLQLIIKDTKNQLAEDKSFSSLNFTYNELTEPLFKSITKYLGEDLLVKV